MRCQVARPVRRAGRGNGSGAIPTPRPGPTPTSSAKTRAPRSARWWNGRPGWSDCCIFRSALKARLADLPAALLRSITWDQGTEMARHLTIAQSLGAPVYFCDSRSPWQRGSNENTNGLLRDYFPKGTDLSSHSTQHLLAVENEINNRPRIILNDRAPAVLFGALLASLKEPSMLRR